MFAYTIQNNITLSLYVAVTFKQYLTTLKILNNFPLTIAKSNPLKVTIIFRNGNLFHTHHSLGNIRLLHPFIFPNYEQ